MNRIILFNNDKCIELSYYKDEISPSEGKEILLRHGFKASNDRGLILLRAETKKYYSYNKNMLKIGSDPFCDIVLKEGGSLLAVIEKNKIRVVQGRAYINGKAYSDTVQIKEGDTVFIGGIKLDYYNDRIGVTGDVLKSNLNRSLEIDRKLSREYRRSPRIYIEIPTDFVEIKKPGTKPAKDKNAILKRIGPPFLTLAITVGVGLLIKRGIFILMSAGMMVATIIASIVSGVGDAKERKENERERVDNYSRYLLNKRSELSKLKKKQIDAIFYNYPDIREIENLCEKYSNRIYERDERDADFLTLSLGLSDSFSSFKVKYEESMDGSTEELYKEMQKLGQEFAKIEDLPYVIDLKKTHLGLVGEKKYLYTMEKAIISELCFFHSYHDVEIIVFTDDDGIKEFSNIYWYPHLKLHTINVSTLIHTGNHGELVLATLTNVLKERKMKILEEKKEAKFLPHFIFILDDPALVTNHSIMEYLQSDGEKTGFSLIYTSGKKESLPDYIKTIIKLDGNEYAKIILDNSFLINKDIKLYDIKTVNMERMARKLAAIKHVKGIFSQIPESISFFEMFNITKPAELNIIERWRAAAPHKSLAVPIGVRAKDDVVLLNLHEKAHGPHGLVAGTTGSGKSEALQTLILSLAVNFPPEDIGFLLIDYKGGGMANLFKSLPHLLGTITNLDGSESMRALASVKSELGRRQRIFNEAGVNNINDYTKLYKRGSAKIPLPHLLIISDEFAELKHEQPEFMAELVSTSRIGRSLGVHLILATQKPSGIVDDQIWSNSKFKLALKVQDAADSKEVIKTPDAAQITNPGRAYLQVGNNEVYELFQSAFSGAYTDNSEGEDKSVYLINSLGQRELVSEMLRGEENTSRNTQLSVVTDYITEIFTKNNPVYVDKVWLPPLPQIIINPHINVDNIDNSEKTLNLKAEIGMADIPETQSQEEFIHDFSTEGNIVVFGSQGSGKSTFLANIAIVLGMKNRTELLNYYILDFGNSALIQFRNLPQTAEYISFEEEEKMNKFIKLMEEEIKTRKRLFAQNNAISFMHFNEKSQNKLSAIIIFIDNYDVVKELSMDPETFINKLSRDGVGVGIYMAVSATRQGAIRYSILNNFKNKIAQYLYDKADILGTVGRSKYQLSDIKGRSLVKLREVNIMQCYTPVDIKGYTENIADIIGRLNASDMGKKPAGIKVMPEVVSMNMISVEVAKKRVGVGLDTEEIEPQYLELSGNVHMIVGKEGTGKTNVLKVIINQLESPDIFICEGMGGEFGNEYKDMSKLYFNNEKGAAKFLSLLEEEVEKRAARYEESGKNISLKMFCKDLPPAVIVIDDGDYFINICKDIKLEMERLLSRALDFGISIVVSTTPTGLRSFDELARILKTSNSGIVLGAPDEQSLLRIPVIRNYKPAPGVGFIFKNGDVKRIHIPLV